jgi:hypothetical protein
MVIMSTKAVEVSIQAVSPPLILSVPMSCGSVGAGGVAASAAGAAAASVAAGAAALAASSAQAEGIENANTPIMSKRDMLIINANLPGFLTVRCRLNCAGVSFTRTNTNGLRKVYDKDLSVADFSRLGRLDDRLDDLFGQRVRDGYFDFGFWNEFD